MCGITGYWADAAPSNAIALAMAQRIAHRGPDDAGVWCDESAGLALAHRRLSILDLSPAGHQPMISPCGRYILVYNGEIYNHLDLRRELEAVGGAFDWRGHSDTETLLAGLRCWGMQGTLDRLNGMFAFALWDRTERILYLARDRLGEKPLYYGRCNGTFLFASELKAFTAHPDWQGRLDRNALTLFLRHSAVPAPWSIYEGIRKLPPAHFVAITESGRTIAEPQCYWNLRTIAGQGPVDTDPQDLIDQLETLLRDAVKSRMAADVPLGAFLSGGIDSSVVAALMQAQSDRPVQTFSIGFHEKGHDEAVHARAVAHHLRTDHTELYIGADEALAVIPQLPTLYDEPFADSSQVPTFLVSRLARQKVTVTLSGDGGDELFCGYTRYQQSLDLWRKMGWMPVAARRLVASGIRRAPGTMLDKIQNLLPPRYRLPSLADKLPKLADVLDQPDGQALYRSLVSHFKDPARMVLNAHEPETLLDRPDRLPPLPSLRETMMLLDMLTYLPDDILTKVDRASMAVSLEARVPLLDHRVVEFAWRVPSAFKYRNGQGKWLLRQVLYRHVPKELIERPKMGFGVPLDSWLRGPLRDWAEALLQEDRLRAEGIFDPARVRRMWRAHLEGRQLSHYHLWDLLMFQAWHETHRNA